MGIKRFLRFPRVFNVLILILMEVPQWDWTFDNITDNRDSLNPYSNGSTTMGIRECLADTRHFRS